MNSRFCSLRQLIILLLTLHLVFTMGLGGWLVVRAGEQAVDDLLGRVQHDLGEAIDTRLQDWLQAPFTALALLARAIEREGLDTSQPRNLQALLQDYLHEHSTLTGFGFGSEANGYVIAITVDRRGVEPVYFAEYADTLSEGHFVSYQLTEDGRIYGGQLQVRDLDIRQRPWYQQSRRLGKPTWSEVYISISRASRGSLALTAAYPLRDASGQWLGVLTAILNLGRISQLLSELETVAGSRLFIVDYDGMLVGSSTGADPVRWREGQPMRLAASDSDDALIRASAQRIQAHLGSAGGSVIEPLSLQIAGQDYRLVSHPLNLNQGIHWQMVMVLPEAVFLQGIDSLLYWHVAVFVGLMSLTMLLALYASRGLSRPILDLAQAAQAMAGGQYSRRVPDSAITELNTMAQSFNHMAEQVQELVATLEKRVVARTQDLQEARDAAETANRAKGAFLASMSHELRTPLTAIVGNSELLTHQGNLNPQQQRGLRVIQHSAAHLLGLIDDVLALSRIEAGRLRCEPVPVELPRLLEDLQEMLDHNASTRGINLHFSVPTTLPVWVNLDGRWLRQILINLLANAIKFTEQGAVCLRVRTHRWSAQQGWLCFTVADTGVGISAADQKILFQPFNQALSGRLSGQGNGLGLALSRRLAHLMGGRLRLRSQWGRGTVLRLQLPASLAKPLGDGPSGDGPSGDGPLSGAALEIPAAALSTQAAITLSQQHLATLATQSGVWRQALKNATLALDRNAVAELLAALPSSAQALQQALQHCLENFDFDSIVCALETLEQHDQDP